MVSFVVTVAVTLFLLLIPVCTTTQGVGTFGVLPNEGGKDVYSHEYASISFSVMLSDILCSLCDSIQNKKQKRRCKRQNCISTRDW
uniref:Uncharacterized protein n=1 Tax=Magallana gigas TaxID=29159 RepID=K1Q6A5_MAGGI